MTTQVAEYLKGNRFLCYLKACSLCRLLVLAGVCNRQACVIAKQVGRKTGDKAGDKVRLVCCTRRQLLKTENLSSSRDSNQGLLTTNQML